MLEKPKDFELKILFKLNSIDSKPIGIFFRMVGFFGTIFFWFLGVGYFALIGSPTPNILINIGQGLEPFFLAVSLGIGMGIDLILSNILQYFFKRPRPYKMLDLNDGKFKVRSWEMTPSFPSAHVHRIFFAVTLLLWGGAWWIVFFYVIGILVAMSRIYLGAHYPLDVIFGAIFGTVFSTAYYFIFYPFDKWLATRVALFLTSVNFALIIVGTVVGAIVMFSGLYLWVRIRRKYKKDMKVKYGLEKDE